MSEEINETQVDNVAEETAAQTESQPAGGSSEKSEKLFTDAYVKLRIDKQRNKYEEQLADRDTRNAELEAQLKEAQETAEKLQHEKELTEWAKAASKETGVPEHLIHGSTQEEMLQRANEIKEVYGTPSQYPNLNGAGSPARTVKTMDEIKNMTNDREMYEAIVQSMDAN